MVSDKLNTKLAYSFDDVTLIPAESEILPRETNVETQLTQNIRLRIPILSAAMDTVTEADMAIAVALQGGLGVIHRNLSPDEQANQVALVKRYEAGFVHEPIVTSPETSLKEVHRIIRELNFSRIPVTQDGQPHGKLMGMISSRDFSIQVHEHLKVKDRMTPRKDLVTAEVGISLEEANKILLDSKHEVLIVLERDGRIHSIVTRSDLEKNELFPNSCKDANKQLRVGAAIGPGSDMKERVKKLINVGVDVLVLDTAHGHSLGVKNALQYIKKNYNIDVIAGNVCTAEGAEYLCKAGADAVKVGVGPGSICTTRLVAGVGLPQISAILDAVRGASKYGIPVIADGGIKYSGEVAQAIAAGASSVMLGGMLAGTKESPGRVIRGDDGRRMKVYRGMGSLEAMEAGSAKRYAQGHIYLRDKFVPEGEVKKIIYKGSVVPIIYQIVGGLRQSMGYCGCRNIPEMHKKAKLRLKSAAGRAEGFQSVTKLETPADS